MERFEAALIAQALAEAGSLRAAARRLQMDPATLLRRKKKYQAQRRLLPD
ncbi:MAG: helix-turn-helix domain-containing protein [Evtepia gabavorous]